MTAHDLLHPLERGTVRTQLEARFVGSSLAAERTRTMLVAVARSSAPVLLLGETGTGKEVAARMVHELSPRSAGPFVAIDCSTLQEGLADTELFGHVRGAFTGAVGPHAGLFRQADGGTLLLDEVGNASLALQARLLRVLETGEVRAVGSRSVQAVTVRVVAATNRDLQADAQAGRFRRDLLYRLDVLRVAMPALRDRPEDVGELAEHLLAAMRSRDSRPYRLSEDAATALSRRSWPGNVRELRNALEAAAVATIGDCIGSEHFAGHGLPIPSAAQAQPWAQWLGRHERAFLLDHLEACDWNRTATAKALGISRQALYDRIRRHGLYPRLVRPAATGGDADDGSYRR